MVYFTSDHHFFHNNVIKYCDRPFDSTEQMNEHMIAKWNATVKPEDVVYYLGDFSLSKRAPETILPRLNGTKHLIAGNHDFVHACHHKNKPAKLAKITELYTKAGFASIQQELTLTIAGQIVHLHHLPYRDGGDGTSTERYVEFRLPDEGKWLLHGHVHLTWKTKGKMINVGVDQWDYVPVSLTQIEDIIFNSEK